MYFHLPKFPCSFYLYLTSRRVFFDWVLLVFVPNRAPVVPSGQLSPSFTFSMLSSHSFFFFQWVFCFFHDAMRFLFLENCWWWGIDPSGATWSHWEHKETCNTLAQPQTHNIYIASFPAHHSHTWPRRTVPDSLGRMCECVWAWVPHTIRKLRTRNCFPHTEWSWSQFIFVFMLLLFKLKLHLLDKKSERKTTREKYMRRNEHIVCVFPQSSRTHSNNQPPTFEKHWKLFQTEIRQNARSNNKNCAQFMFWCKHFTKNTFSFLLIFFFFAFEVHLLIHIPLITIAFHNWRRLAAKRAATSNSMKPPTKFIYLIFQLDCRFEYICHLMGKIPIGCAVRTQEIDRLDSASFALMKCSPCYRRAAICQHTICRCPKTIFFFFRTFDNRKRSKTS